MAPLDRTKRINLQATEEEQAMLRVVAELAGLSMSDYIRQHIRRAYLEAVGELASAAAKMPIRSETKGKVRRPTEINVARAKRILRELGAAEGKPKKR